MVINHCLICGKDIKTAPWRIKEGRDKYCGRDCYHVSRKGISITASFTNCLICGKEIKTIPSRIKKGQDKYCSRKCFYEARKIPGAISWLSKFNFEKGHKSWCEGLHIQTNTGRTQFKKGQVGFWNGKKRPELSIKQKGIRPEEAIKAATIANMGNHYRLGKRHNEETKRKVSATKQGISLENWKGFTNSQNSRIRDSLEYALWRTAVFMRDNYTCQSCEQRGGKLHADHIKPFALYPELRLSIDNGRTLCIECHRQTDTFGCRTRWLTKEENIL